MKSQLAPPPLPQFENAERCTIFYFRISGEQSDNIARLSHAEPLVPLLSNGQLDSFALRQRDERLVALQR